MGANAVFKEWCGRVKFPFVKDDELGSTVENSLKLVFETRGTFVEHAFVKVKARGDKGMQKVTHALFLVRYFLILNKFLR